MAGPPVRQRYNAKARGSVAGGSSHKKRKNLSKERTEEDAQDNETDQHAAVFEDPTAGMSSKKRKRFESYMVCPSICVYLVWVTDQAFNTGQKTQIRTASRNLQTFTIPRTLFLHICFTPISIYPGPKPHESH